MSINADITLKRLVYEISVWADAHSMIESFGYGKYLETFARDESRRYPVFVVNSPSYTQDQWYFNYTLEFICLEWVFDDRGNRVPAASDTAQIIADFENTVKESDRWQAFSKIEGSFNSRKVDEYGADKADGWFATVVLKVKKTSGICDLVQLLPEYDFGAQEPVVPDCPDGEYRNSDGTFIQGVPSGGSFTSDDVAHLINGVQQVPVPTNFPFNYSFTCPVTTTDVNGDPTGVDTGAGQNISFRIYDQGLNLVPYVLIQNTLNDKGAQITLATGALYTKLGTGQTAIYGDQDDGTREQAGEYVDGIQIDFYTLANNNEWGHPKRFTGDGGGYMDELTGLFYDKDHVLTTKILAFPNNIERDYAHRVRRYLFRSGSGNWADRMTFVADGTVGGESGWRAWNKKEFEDRMDFGTRSVEFIDSRMFSFSSFTMWTSTTYKILTTSAYQVSTATAAMTASAKTNARAAAYIKDF